MGCTAEQVTTTTGGPGPADGAPWAGR